MLIPFLHSVQTNCLSRFKFWCESWKKGENMQKTSINNNIIVGKKGTRMKKKDHLTLERQFA